MSSDSSGKVTLASTACQAAAARAHESERADRLFNDPWAALLAGQAKQDWSGHLPPDPNNRNDAVTVMRRTRTLAVGRIPSIPRSVPGVPHGFLVTATRMPHK